MVAEKKARDVCVRFVDLLTLGGDIQQLAINITLVIPVRTFKGEFELAPCRLVVLDWQAVHS
jgi:ABC-type tungstate transport system substrate-binding protein